MTSSISRVVVTPVAFGDPPLLNVIGVHQPWALRAIVELHTDSGLIGLGETYADENHLARLEAVAAVLPGHDPYDLHGLRRLVTGVLGRETGGAGASFGGMLDVSSAVDTVYSPFEVACLDLVGREVGRPVSDLLGGAVRDRVPFSGYLFYKWGGHPGVPSDDWGRLSIPTGSSRRRSGWSTAGASAPSSSRVACSLPISSARPSRRCGRRTPTCRCGWTRTALGPRRRRLPWLTGLTGVVEYLEDPTLGIEGMAYVAARTSVPLATNMCVIAFEHLAPAVAADAVQIVLADHHLWGGLRRSALLGGITETFGMGLSMHSNSHLGVSLAAMVHLAAATPNLTYACDTHYPWKTQDVVAPGVLSFESGSVAVPTAPGLGVELDRDQLGVLHEQYLTCDVRRRDDTGYMRSIEPSFTPNTRRW